MDERTLRLQARFNIIQEAVEKTSNRDIAYATACVAWLESVQYYHLQALHRVQHTPEDSAEALVHETHEVMKGLLKSFHGGLCKHLNLDQVDIINRSGAFKEIVNDICNEKG